MSKTAADCRIPVSGADPSSAADAVGTDTDSFVPFLTEPAGTVTVMPPSVYWPPLSLTAALRGLDVPLTRPHAPPASDSAAASRAVPARLSHVRKKGLRAVSKG